MATEYHRWGPEELLAAPLFEENLTLPTGFAWETGPGYLREGQSRVLRITGSNALTLGDELDHDATYFITIEATSPQGAQLSYGIGWDGGNQVITFDLTPSLEVYTGIITVPNGVSDIYPLVQKNSGDDAYVAMVSMREVNDDTTSQGWLASYTLSASAADNLLSPDGKHIYVRDEEGNIVGSLGPQGDGTSGLDIFDGPIPPIPDGVSVSDGVGMVAATWDGSFHGQVPTPKDLAGVEVWYSEQEFSDIADAERIGVIGPEGGRYAVPSLPGEVWVGFTAYSIAHKRSGLSEVLSARAGSVLDNTELEDRLDAAEQAIADARDALEDQMGQLDTKLDTVESDLATQIAATENIRDVVLPGLNASINELRDTDMPALRDSLDGLEDSLAEAKSDLTTAQGRIDDAFLAVGEVDTKAQEAQDAAQSAQSTADTAEQAALDAAGIAEGKGQVITQISAPTGSRARAENLWVRLPDHKVHIFDGEEWVAATDPDLIAAAGEAATARQEAQAAQSAAEAAQTDATAAAGAASDAQQAADEAMQEALLAESKIDRSVNLINNTTRTGTSDRWTTTGGSTSVETIEFNGTDINALRHDSDANSQLRSEQFSVDPTKAYEVRLWYLDPMPAPGGGSQFYIGMFAYGDAGTLPVVSVPRSGAAPGNPSTNTYFRTNSLPTTEWTEFVAYMLPYGTDPALTVGLGKGNASNMIFVAPETNAALIRVLNWNNEGVERPQWLAHLTVTEVDYEAILAARDARARADAAQQRADEAHDAAGTAQDTADAAMTAAGTKTTVTYSTSAPAGVGQTEGDTHRQRDSSGNIIAEWSWDGDAWQPQQITSEQISNLDVGKLTAGTAEIAELVSQRIAAAVGEFIELTAGQITSGTIDTDLLNAQEIGAAVGQFIEISAEQITAGEIDASRINAQSIAGAIASFLSITTDQLVAGSLSVDEAVANAIWAAKITSRKIMANEVLIGGATNLWPDAGFAEDVYSPWTRIDNGIERDGYGDGLTVTYVSTDDAFYIPHNKGDVYRVTADFTMDGEGGRGEIWFREANEGRNFIGGSARSANISESGAFEAIFEPRYPDGEDATKYVYFGFGMRDVPTSSRVRWENFRVQTMVDNSLIVDGGILARHITASEEMWTKVLGAHRITAGEIDADSLRAAILTAGSVQTQHIALGSVNPDQVTFGLDELIPNPRFADSSLLGTWGPPNVTPNASGWSWANDSASKYFTTSWVGTAHQSGSILSSNGPAGVRQLVRNMALNPEAASTQGFDTGTNEATLSRVGGVVRFTFIRGHEDGSGLIGMQFATETLSPNTEYTVTMRLRASHPMSLATRVGREPGDRLEVGTNWGWFTTTVSTGSTVNNSDAGLLADEDTAHATGMWLEVGHNLVVEGSYVGHWFSGSTLPETLGLAHGQAAMLEVMGSQTSGSLQRSPLGPAIKAQGGEQFHLSAEALGLDISNGEVRYTLACVNQSGNTVPLDTGSAVLVDQEAAESDYGFVPLEGIVTVPDGAVEVQPVIESTANFNVGVVRIRSVSLRRAFASVGFDGSRMQISPQGVRLWEQPDDVDPAVELTTAGSTALIFRKGGATTGIMDSSGSGNFLNLSADDSIRYRGEELEDYFRDSNEHLPRGVKAFTTAMSTRGPYDQETGIFYLNWTAEPGRLYRVTLRGSVRNTAGRGIDVQIKHDSRPSSSTWRTPSRNWPSLPFRELRIFPAGADTWYVEGTTVQYWTSPQSDQDTYPVTFFVTMAPLSGGDPAVTWRGGWMGIEDVGARRGESWESSAGYHLGGAPGTAPPPPDPDPDPPTQTYTRTWTATSFQSYMHNGSSQYSGSGPGGTNPIQGYTSYWAAGGRQMSHIFFNHANIRSHLSGSSINRAEVYLYAEHWFSGSGGTARIDRHNYSSAPNSFGSSTSQHQQSFSRGQGRWMNVGTSLGTALRGNTAKGISVTSRGSNSSTYYGYFAWNPSSRRPKIRIRYTK